MPASCQVAEVLGGGAMWLIIILRSNLIKPSILCQALASVITPEVEKILLFNINSEHDEDRLLVYGVGGR